MRGENQNVGGKLKAISPLWTSPNFGATNESGFSAIPGGIRSNGYFGSGLRSPMWSSEEHFSGNAWYRSLLNYRAYTYRYYTNKKIGLSVCCIKD
jgi:uncharacterized protein (TIGR02145 family)